MYGDVIRPVVVEILISTVDYHRLTLYLHNTQKHLHL